MEDIDTYVQDVIHHVELMKDRYSQRPCILMGHSMVSIFNNVKNLMLLPVTFYMDHFLRCSFDQLFVSKQICTIEHDIRF